MACIDTHRLKVPGGFIRDCLECDCDIGEYDGKFLTATDEQLAELRSRAKHYAYGGTDASELWLISASRALLRALDRELGA